MSEQPQPLSELMSRMFSAPPTKGAPAVGTIRRTCFTPEVRAVDEAKREITFVASTEATDRYGDRLMTRGWSLDAYRRNPVFLWAHDHKSPPIGKTLDVHVEQTPKPALIQRVEFAPKSTYEFADTVFNLYRGKFLRSVSVGFLPTEAPEPIIDDATGRTTGYQFNAMELLELSAVPIPANVEATARAIEKGIITTADAERVFTAPKSEELATGKDYIELAFKLGQLSHSVEFFERVMRDAGLVEIRTAEDLEKLVGHAGSISSVADLERLFKLS